MKIQCKCGEILPDTEVTQKYEWMFAADWRRLLDTVDEEIENLEGDSMKESAIMKIRYAVKTTPIWECSKCKRLVTFKGGDVLFLRIESV